MINLFSNVSSRNQCIIKKDIVPDLIYIENYISDFEHDNLLLQIDKNSWLTELKRRVQHYGYKYNYRARSINRSMQVKDLPTWAKSIGNKLYEDNYFDTLPDQLIINEYLPGQGITNHIDCEPCFEDVVVSISLGSFTTMNFVNDRTKEKIPVVLSPKSAVILKGDARYKWTHGIPSRKSDIIKGIKKERTRRVSLTFRRVIL
ncbi:MAG: alpha-ketoglutarate-dependent dioxygenase AlkB [Aureispira sp.]